MKKQDELFLGLFSEEEAYLLKKNFPIFLMILAILAIFFLSIVTTQAKAQEGFHGVGHTENHPVYQNLVRPGTKLSCCSDKDCRPTTARWTSYGWEALVNGRWVLVPENTILDRRSWDAQAHVCAVKNSQSILCFVEPEAQG